MNTNVQSAGCFELITNYKLCLKKGDMDQNCIHAFIRIKNSGVFCQQCSITKVSLLISLK